MKYVAKEPDEMAARSKCIDRRSQLMLRKQGIWKKRMVGAPAGVELQSWSAAFDQLCMSSGMGFSRSKRSKPEYSTSIVDSNDWRAVCEKSACTVRWEGRPGNRFSLPLSRKGFCFGVGYSNSTHEVFGLPSCDHLRSQVFLTSLSLLASSRSPAFMAFFNSKSMIFSNLALAFSRSDE